MGVTRKIVTKGNGTDRPKKGDTVTIEYTGNLYDEAKGSKNDFRGKQFDSSKGRGPFKTEIGIGKVIKGWDEGVTEMSLGEKSILTISGYEHASQGTKANSVHVLQDTLCQMANAIQNYSDYAYGDRGFPGLIPPNASLVFEVELKAVNDKKA